MYQQFRLIDFLKTKISILFDSLDFSYQLTVNFIKNIYYLKGRGRKKNREEGREREGEGGGEGEREERNYSSSTDRLPKCLQQLSLGQYKLRSQELHSHPHILHGF